MACRPIEETDAAPIDVIWGARNIAKLLGRTEAQVHYLLAKDGLPGAKRVGGKWCIARAKLTAFFELSEDA